MSNYDFKELSSYDFEILIRDLLQEEFNVTIESFKSGRDKGIDLRYAKDENNLFIAQCKHYANSSFSNLKKSLKEEKEKIKKINCKRYILVTSMGLTPQNKDEVLNILSPYCKSTGDILGQDDVNNLIRKYPKVEKDNYKLWLTSINIMERLLHSKIHNQTAIEIENIRYKSKFYVQNKSFFKAKKLLKELNYCIITGIPGIGKTTLAEILILYYLEKGYEVYKTVNSIEEALEVYNPYEKQLFYYDDFLGQTTLEEKLNKNEDSQIIKFLETVGRSKNSKFILTTREYILNQAKLTYERISNFNFDISKCSINLNDYTKYDKAKILFNHLYFANIPDEYKKEIVFENNYKGIINHLNYNPRIIESMTVKYSSQTNGNYYKEFIGMLDNPNKIWGHIYDNQLKNYSKNLLLILTSLPDKVYIEELREAFENLNKKKAEKYGYRIGENDFMNALKELDGNFINNQKYNQHVFVYFSNPSIRDFMENTLCNNIGDFKTLLKNSVYFMQIQRLCTIKIKVGDETKQLLNSCSNELEENLIRNFASKDLSISVEDTHYIRKLYYSLSSRLVYIANLFKENIIVNKNIVQHLHERVVENLTFDDLDNYFYNFKKLIELGYEDLVRYPDAIKKIKNLVFNHEFNDEIEEYFIFKDLQVLFPTDISEDEMDYITSSFKLYYKDSVSNSIDNIDFAEDLKDFRDSFETISEFFKIDIFEELDKIEEAIESLIESENIQEPFDDYDEDSYRESRLDSYKEDALIENMFGSMFN